MTDDNEERPVFRLSNITWARYNPETGRYDPVGAPDLNDLNYFSKDGQRSKVIIRVPRSLTLRFIRVFAFRVIVRWVERWWNMPYEWRRKR